MYINKQEDQVTKEEKIVEIMQICKKYINFDEYKNTRLMRLYKKLLYLNDRKLNNLLKQFRLEKVFLLAK